MLLEIAEGYISRGMSIVPIPPKLKRPVIVGWQKLKIKHINGEFTPDSNIGIILGQPSQGLICVDLDHELAVKLAPEFLPPTGMIAGREGGGKVHWFYVVPAPMKKQAYVSECKTIIVEILADGQQVVVGPSIHPDGGHYENLEGDPAEIEIEELLKCVDILFVECLKQLGMQIAETSQPSNPKTTFTPDTHTDLYAKLIEHGAEVFGAGQTAEGASGYFVRCPGEQYHTNANAKKDCMVWKGSGGGWQARCLHQSCGVNSWARFRATLDPGWLPKDTSEQISDVVLDLALPKVVSAELVTEDDDDDSVRVPVDPGALRIDMSSTPGVLGAMVRYNLDFAPRPQAELAFFSALTAVSAACGQLIRSKSDLRPNLCVMVLSEAGSGKDFPRFQTESALRQSGNEARIGPEKLRSDKTFVRFLHERGSLLIQTDEVMGYFEAVQNKGAAMHVQNIVAIIKEAATSAKKSHWNPMGTGDPAQDMVVPFPHLNMFCTGTKGAWLSFDGKSVRDGFLPRFLIYETTEKASRLRPDLEPGEIPETILGPLRDWAVFRQAGGSGNLVGLPASLRPALIVPVDSAAIDRFRQHSTGIEDRYLTDSDDAATCWRRASASAQQLALVIAAARGPYGIQISLDDANLAIKIVNHTTRVVIDRVFRYVGENEYDTERKRALSLIRESGSMSGREFCRRMKIGIIKRGLILSDLTSQGYVRVSTDGAKNQISVVYVTG
ncbi:MAG: hypothetical protein DWI28_02295 [Planctomycetota bacterium]|nr:MAG: hypothetical protein DWI28_02295 [Planctomycetota bacterium]